MKRNFAAAAILLLATLTGAEHSTPEPSRSADFLRGMCYVIENHGRWRDTTDPARGLQYLKDSLSVSAVSITPFGFIESATSPVVHYQYRAGENWKADEDDETLLAVTKEAHRLGMKVVLAPHLWGRVWCGEWRAEDDAGWKTLFAEYGDFILHYAAFAEQAGVDLLQVGKEMKLTTTHEAEWRDLVAKIRKAYHGKLVYSANWDGEYSQITWWDALDYIGVSEYAPLSADDHPGMESLKAGARAMVDSLDLLSKKYDRPYLLTEVGFTGGTEAARTPWETYEDTDAGPDLDLQARCYETVLDVFSESPRCAGMFWWKWFSDPRVNGSSRNRYDFPPAGKPAEDVLARWYGRMKSPRG